MCGICGELRFDGRPPDRHAVLAMREQLVHRGPDSDGLFISPHGCAALAFRRLRIIDLSPNASQPIPNEDGSVQVVLNGEIYNYRTLREGLVARGHRFRSLSDTEIIAHLYEEKGADCIADLDGMFAIAIWDERARALTLARDRVGKKPLFVYRSARLLAFASEMKAFFAHPDIEIVPDRRMIPYYLLYGYVPGPDTFYRHVTQLEPGTHTTIAADGRTAATRFWRIQFPEERGVAPVDDAAAIAGVRDRVTRAVERRLMSDVPLGAFLSGGIDSTIVVGVMSRLLNEPVKTFSIGFDGDAAYDETRYARMAAERFGTDHTEFRVAPSAVDLIDTLIWHHDGPFGDSSAVPTYIVSKLTRERVTVVLTGDGGDEVFAGYTRFYAALLSESVPGPFAAVADGVLSMLPTPRSDRHWISRARRFVKPFALSVDERVVAWNAFFFETLEQLVLPEVLAESGPVDRMRLIAREADRMAGRSTLSRLLHANFTSYLPDDLLVKTDRCTMANSLEGRSPFLDRELVEYAAALPDHLKLRGRTPKYVLRRAFADLLPPAIEQRGKMGFGVPLGAWFRGELRGLVGDLLLAPGARYRELLSGPYVERLVAAHLDGRANAGQQLWSLICLERWLQLLPSWTGRSALAKQPALADLDAH
jgi:asparagine synthase (glutamine-hydrolysing)